MAFLPDVAHARPAFEVPPGSCDCHVHIFGSHADFPFVDDRVYMPGVATVQELVAMHRAIGISRVVVIQASPQGTDNRCLLQALGRLNAMGHAARGVAVVDRALDTASLEAMHGAGVRGLRVNLESFKQRDPAIAASALQQAASWAADMGWHVQVYANLGVIAAVAEVIDRLPVPVVLDHFGLAMAAAGLEQTGLAETLALVRTGKLYVKLSAPYRIASRPDGADVVPLVRAFVEAGADRLLWGTDWPHTGAWPGRARMRDAPEPFHPIDDGGQLDIFGRATTPAERRRILAENPARLYGFSQDMADTAR